MMAKELTQIMRSDNAENANSCKSESGVSFLDHVISPLYATIENEAKNNNNGRAPHSAWRNYDDFNEYFWSRKCFADLQWPWKLDSSFFFHSKQKKKGMLSFSGGTHHGKTSFVEHRTFLHLYHSFHRLWIFLFLMFQGLTIIAFNKAKFNSKTIRELLSLGPTYIVMMFFESVLDILMMYGAYATSGGYAVTRIFCRFIWFTMSSIIVCYLYIKALQEGSDSAIFKIYVFVIGVYAAIQLILDILMKIPACHHLSEKCDSWSVIRFIKWMYQVNLFFFVYGS
ncbi:1,3-beta-glucan synthase [Zostera marina]|uniref:1,3-beta-glucan synthase n=1 Tax=Zostera marina TaxID=29655 RepID=A0A0K9PG07_ZOSMR|nr:1,3-beta-glucan synthase [Zostera marina]